MSIFKKQSHRPANYWFQETHQGLLLFIVFYTLGCRWKKCYGCNLHSLSSAHYIGPDQICRQVDFILKKKLTEKKKQMINNVVISNNGSVMDCSTFPRKSLVQVIAELIRHCPNLSKVALETRPGFIRFTEMGDIENLLKAGVRNIKLEFAIGMEVFDESLRNNILKKGLTNKQFEIIAAQTAENHHSLKVYLQLKPLPTMSDVEAVEDIHNAIHYLKQIAEKEKLQINLHLNPTFVARGTQLETHFSLGWYSPPIPSMLAKALMPAEGSGLTVYIGYDDEGLAVPGGSMLVGRHPELVKLIKEFNVTQNYALLLDVQVFR